MVRVKIIGAGSIGNHLAHGCRDRQWDVTICDIDAGALKRTRQSIYPQRYGAWDEAIHLAQPDEVAGKSFDVVIIGTPPDTHLAIALRELKASAPKIMVIEKPLAPPSLENCEALRALAETQKTTVVIGYNHTLTPHTVAAAAWIREGLVGKPLTLDSAVRENWNGILKAHPWLPGPTATYLGHWQRGGGAGGEHSHGINNWQHFAHLLGQGRITEVAAMIDWARTGDGAEYDRIFQLNVRTESGFTGRIVQDVVTEPTDKSVTVFGEAGVMRWTVNGRPGHDALAWTPANGEGKEQFFAKTRPDDFKGEIEEWHRLLQGGDAASSPVSLERGLDTMRVLAAAYLSGQKGRAVRIDYRRPVAPECLEIL